MKRIALALVVLLGAAPSFAQVPEIRQLRELIEGGDLIGHGRGLSGGRQRGKAGPDLILLAPCVPHHCPSPHEYAM